MGKESSPSADHPQRKSALTAAERWAERMSFRSQHKATWQQDFSTKEALRAYRRSLPQAERDKLASLIWEIRREKRKGEAGFVGWYIDYRRD